MDPPPALFYSTVTTAVGWEWADREDVAAGLREKPPRMLGYGRERVLKAIRKLVMDGVLQEESIGGRVRRLQPDGKPRVITVGPPLIRFNVDPEILHLLNQQYEPIASSMVASSLHLTLEQAIEDLEALKKAGRVRLIGLNIHGECLWVSL